MSVYDLNVALQQTVASLKDLGVRVDTVVEKVIPATEKMQSIMVKVSAQLTAITNAAIRGHKHLEDLAKSTVGGYLDRAQQLFVMLDEAKARYDAVGQSNIEDALAKLGMMLKLFDPEFDMNQFRNLSKASKFPAPVPAAKGWKPRSVTTFGLSSGLGLSGAPHSQPAATPTTDVLALVSTGALSGH